MQGWVTLKVPTPSGTHLLELSLTSQRFLHFPKQHHQLGMTCSSTRASGSFFTLNLDYVPLEKSGHKCGGVEENSVPVIRIQIQVCERSSIFASASSSERTIDQARCICFVCIMCREHWLRCHFSERSLGGKWGSCGHLSSSSAASRLAVEPCFQKSGRKEEAPLFLQGGHNQEILLPLCVQL